MSSEMTNEAPQQEAMEVDFDGDRTELKQEPEDTTMNGDEKVNGEEQGAAKSGIFKVKVSGLPRFYPLGVSTVKVIMDLFQSLWYCGGFLVSVKSLVLTKPGVTAIFFNKEWLQNKLGNLSLRQRPAAINWTDRQDTQESAVAIGGYCEPLSMEAEGSPLLEATTNQ